MGLRYGRIKHCLIQNCPMKCHRLYLIADFENFSPDTLKMADICCYGVQSGKCE